MKSFAFAALAILTACSPRTPLEVYGQVPPFRLTDQNNQPFDRSALAGKVWVADFIYTTCTGPCPLMSNRMRRVQKEVAVFPDVRLVSFTVDPQRDTPAVLAEYARRYQAEPERWHFLTGDPAALHALGRDGFKLNSVDGSLTHSIRFVLVDRKARIRGYYESMESDFMDRLVADIRRLVEERSS